MATLGWGDFFHASRPRDLPVVVLGHGYDAVRAAVLAVGELLTGLPQLASAVRNGQPLGEELRFLQARVGVTVVLREALATLAAIDMARGLPVIHLDLLGYDEWAHRRGPGSDEALRSLRGIDRVIGRLTRAARRSAGRHYDIWVFSDHGQERTEPYVETHGRSIAEAVGEVLHRHGIEHDVAPEPPHGVQGQRATMLGARIAEFVVPGLELTPRWWDPRRATTTALGPLGHVYLPDPLTSERRAAIAAELVDRAAVPMVLSADRAGHATAWTAEGDHRLPADAASILGPDHPYLDDAARDLVRVCHHPDAGDFVISGWHRQHPPMSFPHENGSHAGPGPAETSAFVWAPADAPIAWDDSAPLRAGDLRTAALDVLEGRSHRPAARWSREPDGTTLRLLTYNVHSCIGLDGTLSPERIARVIARIEPDVVALQELDAGRHRTGGVHQAQTIADHLGMLVEFHPTYEVAEEQFGDAVLSRHPMRVVATGPLPRLEGHPELEPRGAIRVEVDVGDVTYTVINTHLSIHPRERRLQADALLGPEWLGDIAPGTNAVLCGDFNAGPGFPTCAAIGRRFEDVQVGLDGHRPRRTWGGRWPVARIDHIFVDPTLEILHVDVPATHLTRTASDHLPLYADLRPPVADVTATPETRAVGREDVRPCGGERTFRTLVACGLRTTMWWSVGTAWSTVTSSPVASPIRGSSRRYGRCRVSASCRRTWPNSPTTTPPCPSRRGRRSRNRSSLRRWRRPRNSRRRAACSRSAPDPATAQRCSAASPARSGPSSDTNHWPSRPGSWLDDLGYDNVHVVVGDGTLGFPEAAPFDAIVVTAGGPAVPEALIEQLVDGGRMVIPVGPDARGQQLLRVRRRGDDIVEEDLGAVRFVPLVGEQGWTPREDRALVVPAPRSGRVGLPALIHEVAQPFDSIDEAELGPLLDRVGDCSLVLLGEASHGTSEFYRMRERITRELIARKGFTAVAVEADWPDAARIDAYVRDRPPSEPRFEAFSRFPTWMWRNHEVRRVRRLAPRTQCRSRRCPSDPRSSGQLPRARPLQPLHVPRRRDRLSRRHRSARPQPWLVTATAA